MACIMGEYFCPNCWSKNTKYYYKTHETECCDCGYSFGGELESYSGPMYDWRTSKNGDAYLEKRSGIEFGTKWDQEDMVNHPAHYNSRSMEVIDIIKIIVEVIDRPFEAYLLSNIIKYLCRYDEKGNPVQDLEKAKWYLVKLIREVEQRDPSKK